MLRSTVSDWRVSSGTECDCRWQSTLFLSCDCRTDGNSGMVNGRLVGDDCCPPFFGGVWSGVVSVSLPTAASLPFVSLLSFSLLSLLSLVVVVVVGDVLLERQRLVCMGRSSTSAVESTSGIIRRD